MSFLHFKQGGTPIGIFPNRILVCLLSESMTTKGLDKTYRNHRYYNVFANCPLSGWVV
jgi:hypothetical protein